MLRVTSGGGRAVAPEAVREAREAGQEAVREAGQEAVREAGQEAVLWPRLVGGSTVTEVKGGWSLTCSVRWSRRFTPWE